MISRRGVLLIAIAVIAKPRAAPCGTGAQRLKARRELCAVEPHANFFGPLAVSGDISSNLFGQVVNAAPTREVQGAVNFSSDPIGGFRE